MSLWLSFLSSRRGLAPHFFSYKGLIRGTLLFLPACLAEHPVRKIPVILESAKRKERTGHLLIRDAQRALSEGTARSFLSEQVR